MKIVLGMPAFNEGEKIEGIINEIKNLVDDIIVCNDGSTDSTGIIAQKMGAIVINHKKNLGYGSAINSIFSKAREMEADILITFDADGQHRSKRYPICNSTNRKWRSRYCNRFKIS